MTGESDVEHLLRLGVLGPDWILAHCVWLNPAEIEACAEVGAHIVVCPASGAFTAGGIAPLVDFERHGISIGIGSDGPMVNDSADMLAQLKAAFLLQNVKYLTPAAVSTYRLLELATIGGAQVIGLGEEIGSLEVGKKADIAVFDIQGPHYGVPWRPSANLVLSGSGADLRHLMVDGRMLVFEREVVLASAPPPPSRDKARQAAEAVLKRADVSIYATAELDPRSMISTTPE
jgi:5-methylthioadenosine/S-adenosylhomocysteine deaminase